jgi:hypothetical protein
LDASLALTTDGKLFSWGNNASGQLGNGTLSVSPSPVLVGGTSNLAGQTVVAVAAGASGSTGYALTLSGKLYAWGLNSSGQVGNGTTVNALSPVEISLPSSGGGGGACQDRGSGCRRGKPMCWCSALTASFTPGVPTRQGQLGERHDCSGQLPRACFTGSHRFQDRRGHFRR